MRKIIILYVLFFFSGFVSTPIFGMQNVREKQLRVTNGVTCEGCQREFVKAEHRVEHIITIHYACPWCSDLVYLASGKWKNLSGRDQQTRVDHIKACAEEKKTSLWQCQKCSALFHYLKKDHKCGVRHQVNLIAHKGLDIETVLKFEQENTCNKCSKSFVHARACKNHMMREHAICPWCSTQLAEDNMSYKKLNLQQRATVFAHLIECAQSNNESLFACDTCFGVMLCNQAVHIGITCKGMVYQASEKTRRNNDTIVQERLPLPIQEPGSEELQEALRGLGSTAQGSNSSNQFYEQEVLSSGVIGQGVEQVVTDEQRVKQEQGFSSEQDADLDFFSTRGPIVRGDQNNSQEDDAQYQAILRDLFTNDNDSCYF